MLFRPVETDDLDALFRLSGEAGFGLTSLPTDRDLLARRIYKSTRSFDAVLERPGPESYLFVLEDGSGRVIGSSGIKAKVGGYEPFYSYRVESVVHESRMLNVRQERRTLHLCAEHNGPAEIGSLFLAADCRGGGTGRFLSLARFLYMAQFPERFEEQVLAEMRGVSDEAGRSPFWAGLGRVFFDIDFHVADYLSVKNKSFIAELMPRFPIYTELLPEAAQAVIGEVHENTRPALRLLEQEGFTPNGTVDIFDAGVIIECSLAEVRTVRESMAGPVESIQPSGAIGSRPYYLCNQEREHFRACPGQAARTPGGGWIIEEAAAERLRLTKGDAVRCAPARPVVG